MSRYRLQNICVLKYEIYYLHASLSIICIGAGKVSDNELCADDIYIKILYNDATVRVKSIFI